MEPESDLENGYLLASDPLRRITNLFVTMGMYCNCIFSQLFCSLCATFTFNVGTSIYKNIPGQLGQSGLVNFGTDVSDNSFEIVGTFDTCISQSQLQVGELNIL